MVAAVATLGTGAAMGLEGPSIYLGASFGALAQRRFPRFLVGADRRLLLVAGAAAGIAAIFKAPATGAVFALEVPYQDDLARHMLMPALVGSASGYLALVAVNGTAPLFPVNGAPPLSFVDLAGAAALGLAVGLGARMFSWLLRRAKEMRTRGPVWVRIGASGCTIAVLFAIGRGLTGESLVLTPGYDVLTWAAAPAANVLVARGDSRAAMSRDRRRGRGRRCGWVVRAARHCGRVAGSHVRRRRSATTRRCSSLSAWPRSSARVIAFRSPRSMFVAETTGRPGFIVPGLIAAVVSELVIGNESVTTHQVAVAHREPAPEDL